MRMTFLQTMRSTHMYLGMFITPAVLFFALTGALQTFSLHSASKNGSYQPSRWIQILAQVHKKQTTVLAVHRSPKKDAARDLGSHDHENSVETSRGEEATSPRSLPLKLFFVLVSVGLFVSTLTGAYMSYRYARKRFKLIITLVAGVVVPFLLIMI
jgi:hypothetical protein